MGTDRNEIGRGLCPCGNGDISVEHCSPDHPWGGSSWYEARLNCSKCASKYSIYDLAGERPRLVLNSDLTKKKAASAAWHAQLRAIEATPEYKAAQAAIAAALSQQTTAAAKHRLLSKAGLCTVSIGTFRKNQTYRLSGSNVSRALTVLGMPSGTLEALTVKADALWPATQFEPPAVATGVPGLEK